MNAFENSPKKTETKEVVPQKKASEKMGVDKYYDGEVRKEVYSKAETQVIALRARAEKEEDPKKKGTLIRLADSIDRQVQEARTDEAKPDVSMAGTAAHQLDASLQAIARGDSTRAEKVAPAQVVAASKQGVAEPSKAVLATVAKPADARGVQTTGKPNDGEQKQKTEVKKSEKMGTPQPAKAPATQPETKKETPKSKISAKDLAVVKQLQASAGVLTGDAAVKGPAKVEITVPLSAGPSKDKAPGTVNFTNPGAKVVNPGSRTIAGGDQNKATGSGDTAKRDAPKANAQPEKSDNELTPTMLSRNPEVNAVYEKFMTSKGSETAIKYIAKDGFTYTFERTIQRSTDGEGRITTSVHSKRITRVPTQPAQS